MTPQERADRIREALRRFMASPHEPGYRADHAEDLLPPGSVVLTREEAEFIVTHAWMRHECRNVRLLALLAPEEPQTVDELIEKEDR